MCSATVKKGGNKNKRTEAQLKSAKRQLGYLPEEKKYFRVPRGANLKNSLIGFVEKLPETRYQKMMLSAVKKMTVKGIYIFNMLEDYPFETQFWYHEDEGMAQFLDVDYNATYNALRLNILRYDTLAMNKETGLNRILTPKQRKTLQRTTYYGGDVLV